MSETVRFIRLPPYLSLIGVENLDPHQQEPTSVVAMGHPEVLGEWIVLSGLTKEINISGLFGYHVDMTETEIVQLGIEPETFSSFRSSR